MLNFKKKDARDPEAEYYAKKIMPQVRDLWIDKKVIEMTGIDDLFAKNIKIKNKLSRTELEEVYYITSKMSFMLFSAYDNELAIRYFEDNPDKLKDFEIPTFFNRVGNTGLIELVSELIKNADITNYDKSFYEKEIEGVDDVGLVKLIESYIDGLKDGESMFAGLLSMESGLQKLDIAAKELSALIK